MIDEKDLARVEELANKATMGAWEVNTRGCDRAWEIWGKDIVVFGGIDPDDGTEYGIPRIEDAEYIAAVHPAFVLQLIEALRNK